MRYESNFQVFVVSFTEATAQACFPCALVPGELCAQSAAEPESALCSFPGLSCLVCRWSMRKGIGRSGVSVISLVINSYRIRVEQRAAGWVQGPGHSAVNGAALWHMEFVFYFVLFISGVKGTSPSSRGRWKWAEKRDNPLIFTLLSGMRNSPCNCQKVIWGKQKKTKTRDLPPRQKKKKRAKHIPLRVNYQQTCLWKKYS